MNKAIWFSRHALTAAQAAEIAAAGYEVIEDAFVSRMATANMTSDEEVMEVIMYMQLLRDRYAVNRFYGVFPPALRCLEIET